MHVLITGGAGFIGSATVRKLLEMGYDVSVYDNLSFGRLSNISEVKDKIKFINGDIREFERLNESLKDVDAVIHLAAIASVPQSISNPIETSEVNIMGTLNVLEASRIRDVEKVVIASSSSVYGSGGDLPKNEAMCPSPESPYATSKLCNEKHALNYSTIYGIKSVVLRYFNVYGPRQTLLPGYGAVIPKFITKMLNDEPPHIYGDGSQTRDFVFVDDVAEANALSLRLNKTPKSPINIASGNEVSVNQLVEYINKILGKSIKPVYDEKRRGDIDRSYADITLAKDILGWKPKMSIKEGLVKTIDYYKNKK